MKENIDFFSHDIIAKKISTIFSKDNFGGSFVVAINGAWGTGKTHLMYKVLSELNDFEYIKVNFNAWRYASKEDIRRALLICIIDECRRYVENESNRNYLGWSDKEWKVIKQMYDDTERALYTAFIKEIPGEVSIDTGNLLKTGMNIALKFVPWGDFGNDFIKKLFLNKRNEESQDEVCIEKEDIEELWGIFTRSSIKRNIEKVTGVEQFRKSFESMLKAILEGRYEGDVHGKNLKLVVAIDDLDRCLPEDALEILEAIKLFVDYSNTYFMIALDGNIIQKGLDIRYKGHESVMIKAKDYYEKMIDISFNIPALIKEKVFLYIQSLSMNAEEYIKIFDLLFIALNSNLRAWQRYIQKADFNKAVLEEVAGRGIFDNELMLHVYMKLQCFSYQWPELYRIIYDVDTYLLLENKLGKIANYDKKDFEIIVSELEQLKISKEVRNAITEKKIADFILMEPRLEQAAKDNLNILFTFDKVV